MARTASLPTRRQTRAGRATIASPRALQARASSLALIGLAALATLPACTPPRPMVLDESGVRATVLGGDLWCDLPPDYTPDQLVAAAEAALRSRGYILGSRARVLDEPSVIRARLGAVPDPIEAQISIRTYISAHRINVSIQPWGNDAEARLILRAMLASLGYGPESRGPLRQPPILRAHEDRTERWGNPSTPPVIGP